MKSVKRSFKFLSIFIIFILIFSFIGSYSFGSLDENVAKLNNEVQSEAAVIIDAKTGKILYDKNAKEKKYPASTTKIMTAILAIEQCNLDETATASEYAINSIPSGYTNANIQIGETLSIKDLLYALMLKSANEAAVVLAEHVSGSVEDFSVLMNEKAKEIGCENTHFVNPNGVHSDDHYSTAYDMALIGRYCMQNETFREIVGTTSYTLPTTNMYEATDRTFANTNSLIIKNNSGRMDNYYYPYATGMKTGYTSPAKNCFVGSASKNGFEIITTVLGAMVTPEGLSERFLNTISMMNFAFDNYCYNVIKEKGNFIDTVEIENATKDTKKLGASISDDITALVSSDFDIENLDFEVKFDDNLEAPISKGDKVGKVIYHIEGLDYEADLIADNDVEKKTYVKLILYIAIAILIVGIIVFIIDRKKTKPRKKVPYRTVHF